MSILCLKRMLIGVQPHEPGPNDAPGPHYESYGSSFGNMGPLPRDSAQQPPWGQWSVRQSPTIRLCTIHSLTTNSHPPGRTAVPPLPASRYIHYPLISHPYTSLTHSNCSRACSGPPPAQPGLPSPNPSRPPPSLDSASTSSLLQPVNPKPDPKPPRVCPPLRTTTVLQPGATCPP